MYSLETSDTSVIFASNERRLRLAFVSPAIVRVTCTEGRPFRVASSLIVTVAADSDCYILREEPDVYFISTTELRLEVDKRSGAIRYSDASGKLLFHEPERGGKWLTKKPIFRNVFTSQTESTDQAHSIDGARAAATKYETLFDRDAFEARLDFVFSDDEAIFGLGSHEEGYGNLRGRSRELYQQNMKAVVPCLVSTRGYGVLLDCASLMTFHDDALGSYWWADAVEELDFYVFTGPTHDDRMQCYRVLTGPTPMLPRWAFGFMQSKERYVTADEILAIIDEYRRRQIPLDAVVLDWKSWPNGSGWGQKSFDPMRFPSPTVFMQKLHQAGAHLMLSVWPIMTGDCPDQLELLAADGMLGNRSTCNAFLPEARAIYWRQANEGLFAYGVDAWWCDCTEPFEADWAGAVKPEPHLRLALNTGESKRYLDAAAINAYSLVHSKGIYEGQRQNTSRKRVFNLTRSSYAGQHRYGTVTWNGDICATWETLRRCIPEGLNFCATGEAYWSVDIGGFFLDHRPDLWFWRGDYPAGTRGLTPGEALAPDPGDTGSTDLGFHELYTRWMQYAVFLPVFRSHGTDAAREIWRFGEPGNRFYDAIADAIRLRYRLIPYLYSLAAQVTNSGASMMRALALGFPADTRTHDLTDQYLFGSALMVCPVVRPMLYGSGSTPLEDVQQTREVYLPAGHDWFDFWSPAVQHGGQTITADCPLDRIPLYLRAGSILPLGEVMQHTSERPDASYEFHVYTGADATFALYEDAGDSYAYESGDCAIVDLRWTETTAQFTLAARRGSFPELLRERLCNVILHSAGASERHTLLYTGAAITITRGTIQCAS
jgi:alpha-D-xyloside xylohydrolase